MACSRQEIQSAVLSRCIREMMMMNQIELKKIKM